MILDNTDNFLIPFCPQCSKNTLISVNMMCYAKVIQGIHVHMEKSVTLLLHCNIFVCFCIKYNVELNIMG